MACGSAPESNPTAANVPLLLVTVPADATATPTPFQPVEAEATPTPLPPSDTPMPAAPTKAADSATPTPGVPTDTLDPSSLLPGSWTPPAIYGGPGAPTPFPILTDTDTVTFLLLGSDTRGGTSFRTDTIVLAAVRPKSGQVSLVSIPRDLWIYIPTHGFDRINTAYEYGDLGNYPGGGPGLLKDTILYNLGVRVDHLAMIDFNGFIRVVNTLGGLDVPVFCPYTDWHLINPSYDPNNENNWSLFTVGPGIVHMDGDLALWYARARKKSSDFDRGRRSQEVLRALYARGLQTNVIAKIPELYADLSSTVTTDLNLADLLKLAPLSLHLTNADIRSYYIGREDVTPWVTPAGADVLLPNGPAILSTLQQALSPSAQPAQDSALTVEIRNGTGNTGWDALAAQRLNYAGYNTRLASADRNDYSGSLLYDLSATPDANRDASLLAILGLPQSALVLAPMQSDVPYVLIVGADYQPCFNPATLAP
ncbi:MAG TPA: LCP family protein [Streptosporangiaceae bacterium]|nr:LCP family protein [Streptosporangiaceae bacterium]